MSTTSNQYILYGTRIPYDNDTYEKYDKYVDNAFKGIRHHNGLCVLYDGRDGRFILIGRVFHKSLVDEPLEGPISFPVMSVLEEELLKNAIEREFDLHDFKMEYWFVTMYR